MTTKIDNDTYDIISCNGEVFTIETKLLRKGKYFQAMLCEEGGGWQEVQTRKIKIPQQGEEFRQIHNLLLYGDELLECFKEESASTRFMLLKNVKYFGLSNLLIAAVETWGLPPTMNIPVMAMQAAVGSRLDTLSSIIKSSLCTDEHLKSLGDTLHTEITSATPRKEVLFSLLHAGILPDANYVISLINLLINNNSLLSHCESSDANGTCEIFESLHQLSPGCLAISTNYGETLLHKLKTFECINYLVSISVNMNKRDGNGRTPIFTHLDDEDVTELLVDHGVELNTSDLQNQTVLHTPKISFSVLKTLLKGGADANVVDVNGNTPLHIHTSPETVELLLDHDADPTLANNKGEIPLHLAEAAQSVSLLLRKSDANSWTVLGRTPLHYPKTESAVELLLKAGAYANATSYTGETPLHLQSNGGCIQMILRWGGDPKAKTDINNETPLHFHKDADAVEALIAAGANVDAETYYGTPLFCQKTGESTIALLKLGASPRWCTTSGETPLHVSRDGNSVRALLEAGADFRATTISKVTALHRQESHDAVTALIAVGANVNALDSYGETPLHKPKDGPAVQSLLISGCDPNASSNRGDRPLHSQYCYESVLALLVAGADPLACNSAGSTALHYRKDYSAVIALINSGLSPNSLNYAGETPLYHQGRNSEAAAALVACSGN